MDEQRKVPSMVWIGAIAIVVGVGFAIASDSAGGAVIGLVIAAAGVVRGAVALIDYAKS